MHFITYLFILFIVFCFCPLVGPKYNLRYLENGDIDENFNDTDFLKKMIKFVLIVIPIFFLLLIPCLILSVKDFENTNSKSLKEYDVIEVNLLNDYISYEYLKEPKKLLLNKIDIIINHDLEKPILKEVENTYKKYFLFLYDTSIDYTYKLEIPEKINDNEIIKYN